MMTRTRSVGLNGRHFWRYAITSPSWLRWVPAVYHFVARDLALVGPRPLSVVEAAALGEAAAARHGVRPGMVSPWWVRQQANVAFEPELETDLWWVRHRSLSGAAGIVLRAALYAMLPAAKATPPRTLTLLGLRLDNPSMREATAAIEAALEAPAPRQIAFVNADCFNRAAHDAEYRDVLGRAATVWPDGLGVRLAGWLHGQPVRENINGTDLFPRLCATLAGTPHSVFLLGGQPGVAARVAGWIATHHPTVHVAGTAHGYFAASEEALVIDQVRRSGATLLLVAFGAPRQDVWIARHLDALGVKVAIGVGGLFDFYSGRIRRAAPWLRELGLEWLWRLLQEPRRLWRRYCVGNVVFMWSVVRSRAAAPPSTARVAPARQGLQS